MIRRLRIKQFDIDIIQYNHNGRWVRVMNVAPTLSRYNYRIPYFPGACDHNSLIWRY
jgi:hypothetical protein